MINTRCFCLTLMVMLSCFLAEPNSSGQVATATILGTVTDASGAAIPGGKIDVKNTGTGVTQSAISNELGRIRCLICRLVNMKCRQAWPVFRRSFVRASP